MLALSDILARAKAHHHAGQLREAEQSYREILQADPTHLEALYLLGAACHAQGKLTDAAESLERALCLKPDFVEAHNQLGLVRAQQGRLDEAETCHRTAIRHRPSEIAAHGILGNLLRDRGKLDEAAACYQCIVELDPSCAEAHNDLGITRQQQQRFAEAIDHYRRAVGARPDFAFAYNNLGGLLAQQDNLDEAVVCYRRAISLKSDFAEAHYNLGMALAKQDRSEEAVACYRRALTIKPDYAAAQNNLGIALTAANRLDEAVACYRQAVALRPQHAESHCNLGQALVQQNQIDDAVACFHRALALKPDFTRAIDDLGAALTAGNRPREAASCFERLLELQPDSPEAHWGRAHALLLLGQFTEGWAEYEWRLKCDGPNKSVVTGPRWTGEPLPSGTILLICEQGFGDTLHFIRYAELVKQRVGRVVVACPKPLIRLVAGCAGVDSILPLDQPTSDFDVQARLLSLPGIFGTTLDTVPAKVPYLGTDADLIEHWQREFDRDAAGAFKIGIAWQGNPSYGLDRFRSIPLSLFDEVTRIPGVRVYSLQMGAGREQIARLEDPSRVVDLGDRLGDFHDTAAIVRNLDLVITCDSAPAHLAGALGVPVWLVLAFAPYWPWMLDREDSPWYPTMRLFRQRQPSDWRGVFDRISAQLRLRIADRK